MDDLISRQSAIDCVNRAVTQEAARWAIKELPSAQPERKRGKWAHSEDIAWSGGGKTTCSACAWSYSDGAYLDVYEFNFCPNCGAEMKER